MADYKLTYFDIRGYAEISRLIFSFAQVDFDDVKIPYDKLTSQQKSDLNLPWGLLPILELKDGRILAQSITIARFLAKRFNLVGSNEWEAAKCDEIGDALRDYIAKWRPWFEPSVDDKEKENLVKTIIEKDTPYYVGKLDKILENSKSGWLVGDNVTWVDILASHVFYHYEKCAGLEQGLFTEGYPLLQKLVSRVNELPGIKKYLQQRPNTTF